LSGDARFLLTYAGFGQAQSGGILRFLTYDLRTFIVAGFDVPAGFFPLTNDISISRGSGLVAAPLKGSLRQTSDGAIELAIKPRRDIEICTLAADGSVSLTTEISTPKGSPVGLSSAVSLSKSGALGFVPTTSGDLLTFDTLTGDIVDAEPVGTNTSTAAQLLEAQGLLTFTNSSNRLFLLDIGTAPAITGVEVHRSTTTLLGARFLSGARVQINGVDAGEVNRDPNDPGHVITISRGKKDFPPGQSSSISVINRDGLASQAFILMR
jgi:hypothetical protein